MKERGGANLMKQVRQTLQAEETNMQRPRSKKQTSALPPSFQLRACWSKSLFPGLVSPHHLGGPSNAGVQLGAGLLAFGG